MKNQLFFMLALIALIVSCTKENEPVKPDYYLLKPGNYWIYQTWYVMGDTTEQRQSFTDSTYVEKDTVIGEYTYYKIMGKFTYMDKYYAQYVRDSSGCLVNDRGIVSFSYTNFFDTLYARTEYIICRITYKMDEGDTTMTVPAGTFTGLYNHGRIYPLKPSYPYGIRHQGDFRVDGVGLVRETVVEYGSLSYLDKRLIRYHVE